MVKTNRSTLHMLYKIQQSATQDSDYIHVAIVPTLPRRTATTTRLSRRTAASWQQPGLARRLPDTEGAKVLPTSDQVGFHLASTHQMAPRYTSD